MALHLVRLRGINLAGSLDQHSVRHSLALQRRQLAGLVQNFGGGAAHGAIGVRTDFHCAFTARLAGRGRALNSETFSAHQSLISD